MNKISILKLGNRNQTCLKEKEMETLVGGNYCAGGDANYKANNDEGKCSCICFSGEDGYSECLYADAGYIKNSDFID